MNRILQLMMLAGVAMMGLVACTPADFVMKTPPARTKQFPKANAVTLLQHIKIHVSSDGKFFKETKHVQVMALNQLGLSHLRSAKAEFHEGYTKVTDVHSRVIRAGDWVSKRNERIFAFPVTPARVDRTLVVNGSSKVIPLGGAYPGAVGEYRFTRCGDTWLLNRRFLQGKLPILKTIVEISAPGSVVRAKLFKGMNSLAANKIQYTKGTDPNDSARTLHRWVGTNVPAVEKAAKAPHGIARAARVVIAVDSFKYGEHNGSQRSWNDIAAFYAKTVGDGDKPTPTVRTITQEVTKGAATPGAKIASIIKFVTQEVRLVPVGLGLGKWAPQPADFTLKHRYGDVKAKVTLAIAMLSAAGIKAQALLSRSSTLGPLDQSFPANVFDSVVLHIPDSRFKFYDLRVRNSHIGMRSPRLSQTDGLLVDGAGGKIVALSWTTRGLKRRAWTFQLQRNKKRIVGTFNASFSGGQSSTWLTALEQGTYKDKKAQKAKVTTLLGFQAMLKRRMKAGKVHVTDVSVKKINMATVSLTAKFWLPLPNVPKGKVWVPMHTFTEGLPASGEVVKRDEYPMFISDAQYQDKVTFKGWTPIEYPQNKAIEGQHASYKLSCNANGLTLQCERDLNYKSKLIPVAHHDAFRNDVKSMRERDFSLIVLMAGTLDKDKDGTPDDKDRCPTVPGPKNLQGCPDTDGDGIVDIDDKCPNLKGLPNTVDPSKHGCPKVVLVQVTEKEIKILQKIFFAFGRATIRKKSFPVLDQVAAVLDSRKKFRVRIEGHTDNVGNKRSNKRLSDRRAAAVLKYLVKKGIDKERLESIGYGMEKPLVPNTNKENRGKNRRVQFSIIQAKPSPK